MNKKIYATLISTALTLLPLGSWATPSTQIWNPSTDTQAKGTYHLGIDNYFSINGKSPTVAFPSDLGLTYGVIDGLEVGADLFYPGAYPLQLNAKYALAESDKIPALAVGIMNVGTKTDVNNYNIIYGLVAKSFDKYGRISAGLYSGNEKLLVDEKGDKANTGVILSWDKYLTKDLWASVDYASGKSSYGTLSIGGSYNFAANVSLLVGYTKYNNDKLTAQDTLTTQLDINL